MIELIDSLFYLALVHSSSRLTALLLHVILNEGLSLFIVHFEHPPKWCTYSVVWLLHGWCYVKPLPSW